MKKIVVIHVFMSIVFVLNAQRLDKIDLLYRKGNYEKAIEKAEKVIKKHPKVPDTYYYVALSEFGLYNKAERLRKKYYMQKAISYTIKGFNRDSSKSVFEEYKDEYSILHDSLKQLAIRLYHSKRPSDAEYFLKYLAIIFNDTIAEYRELLAQREASKVQKYEQQLAFKEYSGPINQKDLQGRKQGVWIEKYDDGTIKSEIFYKDGHPAGVFRLYYPDGRLKANLYFDPSGTRASAILYRKDGSKLAMGYYWKHKKDSLWQYFHNDSIVIAEEHWTKGIKNGAEYVYSIYYYPNILEEKHWKNGKLDSIYVRYYPWGTPKFVAFYKNGLREGPINVFDENGKLIQKGFYKDDLPDSIWTYWNDSTKTYDTLIYNNGKLLPKYQEMESKKLEEILNRKLNIDINQFFIENRREEDNQ